MESIFSSQNDWTNWQCSCHVTYTIPSESTLYSCLNVKELLAWSRCRIWRLSGCNWIRTQNHLVHKKTLNHLAKLLSVCLRTKWFWVRIQLQSLDQTKLEIGKIYDRSSGKYAWSCPMTASFQPLQIFLKV